MLDADVSGAPVVDEAGHLMGVLTEKDLIWKVGCVRENSTSLGYA